MPNLLLIESPGKLKKLGQILGSGWMIKASMGHIRELANDGEDALGFDLGADRIDCRYQPRDARAKKVLAELRRAVQQADQVYIATDPDREGETIGWHLQQALHLKNPQRVVYSEITPQAVRTAIAQPRRLDQSLIAAGRARDCLDKLVGYKGSRHVVWPLNTGAKSMGRVQSATLHLLCVREREIQSFVPQDYWSVWVTYQEGFKAFYRSSPQPQRKAASQATVELGKGSETESESERITSQSRADQIVAIAQSHPHRVIHVEGKQTQQSPPPPFVTSTLQQAAGSKLHFSPEQTMKVAQSLYEKGHITYMRTDSVHLSADFCVSVRQYLQQHDPTNVPRKPTQHRAIKGSQEAHEAIRPTDVNHLPQSLATELPTDAARLYELIWNRAVASQCAAAQLRKTRIVSQSGEAYWEARGQVLEFPGYTRYWNNLSADAVLPTLMPEQALQLQQAQAEPKQTQPPPRYSEPKLVKLMEQKGIGRPSTYAPTIKTLRQRDYVALTQGKLIPTALGLDLDQALEQLLPDLIQPEFTAQMETALDAIASGHQEWQTYLLDWHQRYFAPALDHARQQLPALTLARLRSAASPDPNQTQGLTDPVPEAVPFPTTESAVPKSTRSKSARSKPPTSKASSPKAQSSRSTTAPLTTQPPASTPMRSGVVNPTPGTAVALQSTPAKSATRKPSTRKPSTRKSTTVKSAVPKTARGQSPAAKSSPGTSQPMACPTCGEVMNKVASRSKKLAADHFLRCSATACDTVMFWNANGRRYELPYAQRNAAVDPTRFTDHPCPVCGAMLERYAYTKDGQDKIMLRCSLLDNRRGKCKDVAFFQSRGEFWSPQFGTLNGGDTGR